MKAVIRRNDLPGLIIIALIGIALTTIGYVKMKRAMEAKNWPVTTGTVTSSNVAGGIKYYPSVTYTYSVNGETYSSASISNISFATKKRAVVEEFVGKYPVSSSVKVFYNPSDPSGSFLEPGINAGNFYLLAFGIVLLLIPILLLLLLKLDLKSPA